MSDAGYFSRLSIPVLRRLKGVRAWVEIPPPDAPVQLPFHLYILGSLAFVFLLCIRFLVFLYLLESAV